MFLLFPVIIFSYGYNLYIGKKLLYLIFKFYNNSSYSFGFSRYVILSYANNDNLVPFSVFLANIYFSVYCLTSTFRVMLSESGVNEHPVNYMPDT